MTFRFGNRVFLACAVLFAFGAAPFAQAAVYTVGGDGACNFTGIGDAAAAADAHAGADEIHVAGTANDLGNPDYTNQAISVSVSTGEQLDIIGGFADCSQAASTGIRTVIDGAGGATEPVFRITVATGGLVRMSYLTIQHGDEDGSGKGGGIYFKGDGILEINHSVLTRNTAGYGGGIYAQGTDTHTELVIGVDVSINQNTARFDGGGVVNDGTEMTMTQPDSSIAFNHAPNGYGGGLLVKGDDRKAYTYLGTTGFGTSGAVFFNDAKYGGGVALHGDDHDAVLHLFTTDQARPMRISNNTATSEGGGLYLGPNGGMADLWAWNAWIEGNIAPRGAAIAEHFAFVRFNDSDHRPLGAIDCPVGAPCGGIVGNAATDESSQPSGGVVEGFEEGNMQFNRMAFRGNIGKSVIAWADAFFFRARHVEITGNTVAGNLIATNDSSNGFRFENVTIAGNSIGDSTVLRIGSQMFADDLPSTLHRTIIWQPGKTTLRLNGGPQPDLLDDMVSERGSVDGGNSPYVVEQDPRFVDPEHGDYGLRAGSPAIDDTSSVDGDTTDLYGNPRDVDLAAVANFRGLRDIGAIERQALQPLVLNSDFNADLRLWKVATAGVTSWDSTRNASGGAGSGSAHITVPSAVTGSTVGGIVQCVHLPGPGTYALNGWGHGTGTDFTPGDIAELYWEYRRSGGESCTGGTPTLAGWKTLSNGNSWIRPATPAYIEVTEQDWTYTSSIAVTLVAQENGPGGGSTNAWFDGITLELVGDDTIFANGFDLP